MGGTLVWKGAAARASVEAGAGAANDGAAGVATPGAVTGADKGTHDAGPLDEESAEAVKAKKAAQAKARRAKKKAEKDAEAAGEIVDDDPLGVGDLDAVPVSLDDVKDAMRAKIKAENVEAVQAIFLEFGAKKLTELEEANYADVIAKLTA